MINPVLKYGIKMEEYKGGLFDCDTVYLLGFKKLVAGNK